MLLYMFEGDVEDEGEGVDADLLNIGFHAIMYFSIQANNYLPA